MTNHLIWIFLPSFLRALFFLATSCLLPLISIAGGYNLDLVTARNSIRFKIRSRKLTKSSQSSFKRKSYDCVNY